MAKFMSVGHAFMKYSKIFVPNNRVVNRYSTVRCLHLIPNELTHSQQYGHSQIQTRHLSGGGGKEKNFISSMIDNIKNEMAKNKDMKENLKKFREEAKKLEESDALKKARQKFEAIQSESTTGTDALKKRVEDLQSKVKQTLDDTEITKKGKELAEELSKTAGKAGETISKQAENISQSKVYKSVSEGVDAVRQETLSRARLYQAPAKLRKRDDFTILKKGDEKVIEANEDATGVQLHKDSKWFQSWQDFKDNNQFVHKMFDMKTKYEESDNVVVRATRTVTDKFSELFGGLFSKTEMSEVLTEICKMDPTFEKEKFLRDCQVEFIPNILESMVRGELEVLQDWCYEAAFNTIAHPIKEAQKAGYFIDSKVLDISHLDLVAGKMMEQGPVLVISFQAQQIICVTNKAGKVVEGDPDKIMRVFHVWAFCRDQSILDPKGAWRIIDLSSQPSEQFL